MREKPIVHLSNSTRTLCDLLRQELFFRDRKPFAQQLVILPDKNLKNILLTHFMEDKRINVALGIDFCDFGSSIQNLYYLLTGKNLNFPTCDLLALQLEPLLETPQFASALAQEFIKYGKFGSSFLKKWPDSWQKKLWDQVFSKWNYPYELLEKPFKKPKEQVEIHLFNFPFLPKLYHLFFAKLAAYFPVHYYQFSPCREFWSDTVTNYEKMSLLEKNPQLSFYLEEGNSLLKNLGRMGRETFRLFEEEDFTLDENYVDPPSETYLAQVQKGILNFQEVKLQKDASVLLIPAPSKLREIEILYTKLLELKCKPTEIRVFAPDIAQYAPLIELVFGAEDSLFDFAIHDISACPLLQTLFDLFALQDNRFTPEAVFKLFASPYFNSFSEQEIETIRSWVDKSGIKWGVDQKHRASLLPNFLEETKNGTWEEAFDHLLDNLIFVPQKASDWDLPYLDFSQSELLGKAISLVRSLRKDIDFVTAAELPAAEWADFLLTLLSRYFTPTEEELAPLQEKILLLKELDAHYTFPAIKRYLGSSLNERRGSRTAKQFEAITFRSLKPGAIFSSKVIALLGMSEGAFPRPYIRSSVNLLENQGDYCPITPEEDRYLFLEALSAAENQLFFFYPSISDEDGKEQPPSLLIQELDPLTESHPPFPFHHQYFSKPATTYPMRYYNMARAFYTPKHSAPFIPAFLNPEPLPTPQEIPRPSLELLLRFAKHPLRFYCNHVLNLYLHYDEVTDDEFSLSPLHRHRLLSHQDSLTEAEERGHLPLGRFKEVAKQKICLELETPTEPKLSDHVKDYPLYLNDETLQDYLVYYHTALQTPSPFHPELTDVFLKKDHTALSAKIKTLTDPYCTLCFSQYNPEALFNTWAPLLRKTFAPLLEIDNE